MHVLLEKYTKYEKDSFVALAALGLSACDSEPKFKVEGEISGADGWTLYPKLRLWKVLFLWILSS